MFNPKHEYFVEATTIEAVSVYVKQFAAQMKTQKSKAKIKGLIMVKLKK